MSGEFNRLRRLGLVALLVVMGGLIGRQGMLWLEKRRSQVGRNESTTRPIVPRDFREGPRGVSREGGAADAKLRSLLEVRPGEVAMIRLSEVQLERLLDGDELVAPGAFPDEPSSGPAVIGIFERTRILRRLEGSADGIEGEMDVSGEAFEWRGHAMKLSGTMELGEMNAVLELNLAEGDNALEFKGRMVPGSVLLLRSGEAGSEGILIVVGGSSSGAEPLPE